MFEFEEETIGNETIYKANCKAYSEIVNKREKQYIKLIQDYCKKNNMFCDLIDEDKLKLILKLGVEKYRQLESEYDLRQYIGE